MLLQTYSNNERGLLANFYNTYLLIKLEKKILGKNFRIFSGSLLILILALTPVLQTSPTSFLQLPTASATGGIVLNNTATVGTVKSSPYEVILPNFNAGTGSNRVLIVGVSSDNQSVSSVTFGGTALTKKVSSFVNQDSEFWYLVNPSGTGSIIVKMSGATSVVVGAYAFSGVDQTSPLPTTSTNSGTSNPTISITTANANSLVLDLPSIWGAATLSSPTCTQQWDTSVRDLVHSKITGASSSTTKTLPGSVTCSWTGSPSSNGWDDVAVEVKAATLSTIALNNVATSGTPSSSSPYQVIIPSFNVGTGSNRLLVVGVDTHGTDAWVNSITFGSASLSKAVSSFQNNYASLWYLANPSGTGNITVTLNARASVVVGAYAFSGVDQTNPIPTNATNFDTCSPSCTSPTVSITTQYANSWVVDSPSIWGGETLGTPTCTQQWNTSVQDGIVGKITGASSTTNTSSAGSITCSWTPSPSSSDFWDDVAIEVKAATTPSTGVLLPLYNYPTNINPPCEQCSAIHSHQKYPSVPMVAIINQDSGKPYSNDTNWYNETRWLQQSGITVLGYVATGYDCTNAPSQCSLGHTANSLSYDEQAAQNYSKFYHVNGTFFDEMSNNANSGNLTFYGNLNSYAKNTLHEILTVGNPGTSSGMQDFNATFDNLMIWENPSLPPVNSYPSWESSFSKSLFSVYGFGVPDSQLNSTYYSNTTPHVGYLYFNNFTDNFHVSNYLNSTLANLTRS